MLGLMQDWPLLCHRIIDHAAIQHGNREVVSRSIEAEVLSRKVRAMERGSDGFRVEVWLPCVP